MIWLLEWVEELIFETSQTLIPLPRRSLSSLPNCRIVSFIPARPCGDAVCRCTLIGATTRLITRHDLITCDNAADYRY